MDTLKKRFSHHWLSSAMGIVATGLLLMGNSAYAQDAYSMAPPIDGAYYGQADTSQSDASSTVFNWTDIPQDQEVPIQRAVFDQGGYQLYDTAGETIVVPFTSDNLYVMKFARSSDGTTYFVNEDGTPVLYLPQNGYLENASVSGARWYPFSQDFCPATPVYMGIAPDWSDFVAMGWYPDMDCYGGYWCGTPLFAGGFFVPTVSLVFVIGGNHCDGWRGYDDFCRFHQPPFHTGFFNRNVYRWADGPHSQPFIGGGGERGQGHFGSRNQAFGSGHENAPSSRGFGNNRQGAVSQPSHVFRGIFGGSNGQGRSYGSAGASQGQSRVLDSGRATYGGPTHQFRGAVGAGASGQVNPQSGWNRSYQGGSSGVWDRPSSGRTTGSSSGSSNRSYSNAGGGGFGGRANSGGSHSTRDSGSQSSGGRDSGGSSDRSSGGGSGGDNRWGR